MTDPLVAKRPFVFRGVTLPDSTRAVIEDYIRLGKRPGLFLESVICNDLKKAIERADDVNLPALPAIVAYFYNEAPAICWGSKEIMEAWVRVKRRAALVAGE